MARGGRRIPAFFFFATLLVIGRIAVIEAAARLQGYDVGKTLYLDGESRAWIPLVRGMTDLASEEVQGIIAAREAEFRGLLAAHPEIPLLALVDDYLAALALDLYQARNAKVG